MTELTKRWKRTMAAFQRAMVAVTVSTQDAMRALESNSIVEAEGTLRSLAGEDAEAIRVRAKKAAVRGPRTYLQELRAGGLRGRADEG